jgi:Transmembrane domain of unknown function (DUF3566)
MTQPPHGRAGSVDTGTPPGDGSRGPVNADRERATSQPDRPGGNAEFGEATISRPRSGTSGGAHTAGRRLDGSAPGPAGVGTVTGAGAPTMMPPGPGPVPPPGAPFAPSHVAGPGLAPPGPGPGLPPRPGTAPPIATPSRAATRASGPRRARLQVRHVNPWTVLKFSCVVSVVLFFVWLIMIAVLYLVLDASGVVGKINDTVTTINGSGSNAPVTPGIVFGAASIVGVVNIVLFIALSTIGSVVYNLCADLVGGIEVTLSERETV